MKNCYRCSTNKPKTEFNKNRTTKDGLQDICRDCQKEVKADWARRNPGKSADISRKWRLAKPEAAKAGTKRWRDNNPDKVKANFLKRYSMTLEAWNAMFEAQGGCCAICGIHQDQCKTELAVDHCHKTGKVRGLLCVTHNRAIGYLNDDPGLLRKAADYLER